MGLVTAIAGCAGSNEPRRPCCYSGAVQLARLADVEYRLGNGETRRFTELFANFKPGGRGLGRGLAFNEAAIGEVSYDALEVALPRYDANGNTWIEKPELVVLYLVELARGKGLDVQSVGAGAAALAISLSSSDEQGLATLVRQQRNALAAPQAQLFRELEWLGADRQRFSIDVSSSN